MGKMVSPNEILEKGKQIMLEGRDPESKEDWVLIMNFLAANINSDVADSACRMMVKLYQIPLLDAEVSNIVKFQIAKNHE